MAVSVSIRHGVDDRLELQHGPADDLTTVSAEVELPAGDVAVRATSTPTGRFQGDLEFWYGDVPVGRVHLPATTPVSYGVDPFSRRRPLQRRLPAHAAQCAGGV